MSNRIFVAGHKGMVGSSLGWQPQIGLKDGLRYACQWYMDHIDSAAPGRRYP